MHVQTNALEDGKMAHHNGIDRFDLGIPHSFGIVEAVSDVSHEIRSRRVAVRHTEHAFKALRNRGLDKVVAQNRMKPKSGGGSHGIARTDGTTSRQRRVGDFNFGMVIAPVRLILPFNPSL
jgi:hypothetical protein